MSENSPAIQSVHRRNDHSVITHSKRIVVWGGSDLRGISSSEVFVYNPSDLSWTKHETTGEIPPPLTFPKVEGIGDDMYVLLGWAENHNYNSDVYILNLTTLIWRRLEVSGDVPENVEHLWPHRGNSFVSFNYFKEVSVYSIRDSVWWKPTCKGAPPQNPVLTSFVIGSHAYVFDHNFGEEEPVIGEVSLHFCGSVELYRLDMDTWTWERMMLLDPSSPTPGNLSGDLLLTDAVSARRGHTLTVLPQQLLSGSRVLLYGGLYADNQAAAGNCWMIHLDDDDGLSYRWQRCDYLDAGNDVDHRAVVESVTGQVWLLGGGARRIVKLTVTRPLSLLMLSFKGLFEEREGRLRRGIQELPQKLKTMLHNYVESELEV